MPTTTTNNGKQPARRREPIQVKRQPPRARKEPIRVRPPKAEPETAPPVPDEPVIAAAPVDFSDLENGAGVDEPPGADDQRRRGRVRRLLARVPKTRTAAIVGAVIAALVATLVVCALAWRSASANNSLRASAIKTASTYGTLLASYDYHNLNGPASSMTKAQAMETAAYKKKSEATAADLDKFLQQYQASATGKVVASGLASLSGNHAGVLLFVDQTVSNSVQKPNSVNQPLRVEISLVRQGGKWLVDNVIIPS